MKDILTPRGWLNPLRVMECITPEGVAVRYNVNLSEAKTMLATARKAVFDEKRAQAMSAEKQQQEQEKQTTIPPEEPGNVITEAALQSRLNAVRLGLTALQADIPFPLIAQMAQFLRQLRKDVTHTHWNDTDEDSNVWKLHGIALDNLIDEMQPLEELNARLAEWLEMVDELRGEPASGEEVGDEA